MSSSYLSDKLSVGFGTFKSKGILLSCWTSSGLFPLSLLIRVLIMKLFIIIQTLNALSTNYECLELSNKEDAR